MEEKNKQKAQLPLRVNIIFFIIFLLFAVLVLQLGVVQILNGESFQLEIDRTVEETTKVPVPRGKIYDRNGNVIVDNKPLYSITYTPQKGVQAKARLELAQKLAHFISMDSEKDLRAITARDKREYVYLVDLHKNDDLPEEDHEDTFVDRISEEEQKEMSDNDLYQATLAVITDEEIADGVFSTEELEIIRIKKELDKAFALTPQIVKNENVTAEEYALVSENLSDLPGINATTDWEREYPFGSTLRSFLGNISTHKTGIPAEYQDYYMSRGYSRNDRVGRSGLEEQYENVLRGQKEEIKYTTTKTGRIIETETVVQGEKGKDLILSIDIDFQQKVDDIVGEELTRLINNDRSNTRFVNDALAIAMNPQTGELLAVSGKGYDRNENELVDRSYNNLLAAHMPGSIIKGATVLAGFESGVMSPGGSIYDRPIRIGREGPPMRSLNPNIGQANDIKALQMSSNVYMYYVALQMGGETRVPFPDRANASFNPAAWQEMRNYFHQFGLGTSTGIDYPSENIGVPGVNESSPGLLMQFAIGQYSTYSPLQMAQYVSTIANDGYRVRPHFVKELREPIASLTEIGPVYKNVNTDYLNRIQMSSDEIARVQEGFRQVFQERGGTGYHYFSNKSYRPAGKTGTAEVPVFEDGVRYDTINRSIVAYAPMDNPEIAIAVIVPHIGINAREDGSIANEIAVRILDAYFDQEKPDQETNE